MRNFSVFNGFHSYAALAPTSPPGGASNGATSSSVARSFGVAAVQAAAAQQAAQQVAFETAALYAIGSEPFASVYPATIHHQSTAQIAHAFHKV